MRDSLFKIGEMAQMNHVSTQTLRLYARNKLLEPNIWILKPDTGIILWISVRSWI